MFLIPQMLAVVHKYIHACICTFMHAYMRTYMAPYHYIPNHAYTGCLIVCLMILAESLLFDFTSNTRWHLRQFRCHDGPLLKEVVDNALQSIGGHFFLATSQFVHGVLVKIFTCVSMRHPCFATQLNHFGEMLCFERRSCSTPVTSYP